MDERQVQRGQQWLSDFFQLAGLPAQVSVDADHSSLDGSCWLAIDSTSFQPQQIQAFLGNHGSALDALQYLANTAINMGQPEELQTAFTIELDGYRVRRQAELKSMAEAAIAHVRGTGEEYEMAALSSAERRQVHTYLKEFGDLATYSRGKEPDRRLVVRLADEEFEEN